MSLLDLKIAEKSGSVILPVRVQPRAERTALAGPQDGALRIRLTAPALEDRANRQLLEYLSAFLEIPRARLSLSGGRRSRNKKVAIEGLSKAGLLNRLEQAIKT